MAKWFVVNDGNESGPYDDAALRQLAMTGKLPREGMVRREGMQQPVQAGNIKGLFPPPIPKTSAAPAAAPSQASSDSEKPVAHSAFNRLQGAAKSVARAAAIKKLQLHDLPSADAAIGSRAYELEIVADGVADTFAEVRRLEAEIEDKRQASLALDHETLADRTKRLAADAKKRVDVELLLKQRKQLLAQAGKQLREGADPATKAQLAAEFAAAQEVLDKLAALEAEDSRGGGGSPLRRLAYAAAAIPVLLIGLWLLKDFLTTSPEEQHQATLKQIRADAEAMRLRDEARQIAEDRKYKEEQERQAAEREAEKANYAAKRDRQKREEAEARRQQELAREESRLRKEQEEAAAAAEKLALQRANAEKKAAEMEREQIRLKEEHDAAQSARADLAEQLFANVTLEPNDTFELSDSMKKSQAKLELRSPKLSELQQLLADKNWLELISRLNDATYDEYPEARSIEQAYERLQDYEFHLLVRIDRRHLMNNRGPELCSISFPPRKENEDLEYPNVAKVMKSWEIHPDGIGVTRIWKLGDGPAVIALSDPRRIDAGIHKTKEQLGQQYLSLTKKAKLGEIDEKLISQEMRKAIDDAQAKLKAAALKL